MNEQIKRPQEGINIDRVIRVKKSQVETGLLLGLRMSEEEDFFSIDSVIKFLLTMKIREDLKQRLSEALAWKTPSDELLESMDEIERGEGEDFDTVDEMFKDAGVDIK